MKENVKNFDNKPIKEMSDSSTITILKSTGKDNLFIRETFKEEEDETELSIIWLSNKAALEMATWILDNVEEVE